MKQLAMRVAVCLFISGGTVAQPSPRCESLSTMTDAERLTLYKCLPFGSDIDSVAARGIVEHSLGSFRDVTSVYGYSVTLALSFKAGHLDGIGYGVLGSTATSDSLREGLGRFYSRLCGEPVVHDLVSDGDTLRVDLWSGPECDVGIFRVLGVQDMVTWGLAAPGTLLARLTAAERR